MVVAPSAVSIASAAGCISEQWNGADTGSWIARLAPMPLARSIARMIALNEPEMTTWPGSLSLATSHTSSSAAASAIRRANSISVPSSAAIAPSPTGTAACIASPRVRSSLAVVARSNAPAAHSAEYSPRLCPAATCAALPRSTPQSAVSTRYTASACAMIAGWAFSVSFNSSSGPSRISRARFCPSASSTKSNVSRAVRVASASAAPMPTAWLPCPGKMKARIYAPVGLAFAARTRPVAVPCQAFGG